MPQRRNEVERVLLPRAVVSLLGVLTVTAALWACGENAVEPPPPPPPPPDTIWTVKVSAWWRPAAIQPGESSELTVIAEPKNPVWTVSDLRIELTGLIDTVLTVVVPGPGSARLELTLDVERGPVEGVLTTVASARVGDHADTATATLTIADSRSPEIALTASDRAEPGDSLAVQFNATDDGGLAYTTIRATGAAQYADSLPHVFALTTARTVTLFIPSATPLGDSVVIEVVAVDWKANADTLRLITAITDTHPPSVTGWCTPPPDSTIWGDPLWAVGDTLHLTVRGSDDRQLAWLGYEFAFPEADSVPVSGVAAEVLLDLEVPSEWTTEWIELTIFAADSVGNRDTLVLDARFSDGRRPTVVALPTVSIGTVSDFVFDSVRGVLYVAEPDNERVSVLSLQDLQYRSSIPTPFPPRGVDLTVSLDSLVLTFPQTPYIGIVDLTDASPHVDTVRLIDLDQATEYPNTVRVAANNKAVIALVAEEASGTFVTVDFTSGEQVRHLIGRPYGLLTRSEDRSLVVGIADFQGYPYRAAPDAFGGVYYGACTSASVAAPTTGEYILQRASLCDTTFAEIAHPYTAGVPVSTFSAGGSRMIFWYDEQAAYYEHTVPAAEFVEKVFLAGRVTSLYALPGSKRLLVFRSHVPALLVDLP